MKKKIDVTFGISTQIEVDIPESSRVDEFIVNHKDEITNIAKNSLSKENIDNQMSWDNLIWSEDDYGYIDLDAFEFDF